MKHCESGDCDHERHKPYIELYKEQFERKYLWNIAVYVTDRKISYKDDDDLELFQDLIFDSSWGRIHIFFYEELFKNYYQFDPNWVCKVFAKYLEFLEKVSPLFTDDAFHYIFKQKNILLVERVMKELPVGIKLRFIKFSDKYPDMVRSVPKLKIYNLFS